MNVQTFYPVFANGQVLTSEQLNDIVDYLEPQDRLGRRLVGIGVACGFEPDWDAGTKTLMLSAGMAVTSEGYMVAEEAVVLNRCRPYTVPIPSGPEASAEERDRARYPFLFDGNSQRAALELLPIDFQPAEGEAQPEPLADDIVENKTVLLFLERNLEALKNCDINDCSDKGSEVSLILRRLLVARDVADKILAEEAAIAGQPVDRASHPRRRLAPFDLERIHPERFGTDTVGKLHQRTLDTVVPAFARLLPALREAWAAYRPLLQDQFPADAFPDGPVPDHHFLNAWAAYAEAPVLVQYLHDLAHDITQSHNEFLACAARFEAECCPDTGRFPLHVLAGDVVARSQAFAGAPRTLSEYKTYDPAAAQDGAGPEGAPAPRRHHFIPSPAVADGSQRLAELQSLFARTILLAQSFFTRDLLGAEIRVTPSRDGAAPLGARAIPFYYRFQPGGDLIRNWSWPKARSETYGSIFSYQFSDRRNHPFFQRRDAEDFIRIEGAVGRPLGSTIAELVRQRCELGLSFAIEPVWIGWGDDDPNANSRQVAKRAMRGLLLCRLNQIDIVFATLMDSLFEFAVWLVRVLGTVDAGKTTRPPTPTAPVHEIAQPVIRGVDMMLMQPEERTEVRMFSRAMRTELRRRDISANELVGRVIGDEAAVVRPAAQPKNVAEIFAHVSDERRGGELIDRLRDVIGNFDLPFDREDAIRVVYPSVALISRAQELMRVTRGVSLAEFDDDRFATVMRGFAAAYDAYAAVAETDATKAGKTIANTNLSIIANRGFVSTMAQQFASGSMSGQIDQQLDEMFEDMALPRYARLHPGLEHKAGVAAGGTYVLVYASRAELARRLRGLMAETSAQLEARAESIGVRGLRIDVRRVAEALEASSRPNGDDVLEEFVVVADFCLPYLCCEGRCGDQEVERRYSGRPVTPEPTPTPPPPPPEPTPTRGEGKLTIRVMLERVGPLGRGRAGIGRPVPGAQVAITNLRTRQTQTETMAQPQKTFVLPSDRYVVVATFRGMNSEREQVELGAGESKAITLAIGLD
jgi:hypothetical protein